MTEANGKSTAFEDIIDDLHYIKNELQDLRSGQDALAKEVRSVKGAQAKASRWGAFLGAMLAAAASIGVNQCAPNLAPTTQGNGR